MRSPDGRPICGRAIASQAWTHNARTKVASAAGSAPRAIKPPGNVTLNSGDDGGATATPTSTNLGAAAEPHATLTDARRRRSCTQCANVGYLTPSRRANAACESPLFSESTIDRNLLRQIQ